MGTELRHSASRFPKISDTETSTQRFAFSQNLKHRNFDTALRVFSKSLAPKLRHSASRFPKSPAPKLRHSASRFPKISGTETSTHRFAFSQNLWHRNFDTALRVFFPKISGTVTSTQRFAFSQNLWHRNFDTALRVFPKSV